MKEIRWHGRGGQGAKTVSELLAMALMDAGFFVQAFPEYGPERSGAPIQAYTRSSDKRIRIHCSVTNPDMVVVLDDSLIGEIAVADGLDTNGILLVNTRKSADEIRRLVHFEGTIYVIDADELARQSGGRYSNVVAVGALAAILETVTIDDVIHAAINMLGSKGSEEQLNANLRAIKAGYEAFHMMEETT